MSPWIFELSMYMRAVHTNTNQIYNAHKVTPKCESEARIVSHQVKIQITFQFLESQEETLSFEPLFEGR